MPSSAPRERWFLGQVLLPFAFLRVLLVAVAWYGRQFAPSWTYFDPVSATRGWTWLPSLPLDVWGRYDTFWYLDVAAHGYRAAAPFGDGQANLAFFPLFPWLARAGHALLPGAWQGEAARYLVGLAIANGAALAGLAVLYLAVREELGDPAAAGRAVRYLLLWPAGFFLSAVYSESLFLLASAGALHASRRGRWGLAALAGLAAGLCRPTGALLSLPVAWIWARERTGPRLPPAGALAAAAPVAGIGLHAAWLWRVTGDPLALFHAQAAWGRTLAAPWTTLVAPRAFHPWLGPLEWTATALFLALPFLLLRWRRPAWALWSLACVAPVLLSGTLMSAPRLLLAAFPAFAVLGRLGAAPWVDRVVTVAFAVLQTAVFIAWSRFYWVG